MSDPKTTVAGILAAVIGVAVSLGYLKQDDANTLLAAGGVLISIILGYLGIQAADKQ